jgi:glycosyltransferase involved in cell wall biosynthesis
MSSIDPPLVSIVVPSYNQARYLPTTLDHLLHQDYPNLELVIVDDASTDGSAELLRDYLEQVGQDEVSHASRLVDNPEGPVVERTTHQRYPQNRRVELVLHQTNQGATATYNDGFRRVRGQYCGFVVSDDIPALTMISELVEALDTADLVYADMSLVDDDGRILRILQNPDYDFQSCLADWYRLGVAILYRRELHDHVGFYDPRYASAQDYDMHLRFALAGARIVRVPKVLYAIRSHGPERQVGLHSPEAWDRIYRESIEIARRARQSLQDSQTA